MAQVQNLFEILGPNWNIEKIWVRAIFGNFKTYWGLELNSRNLRGRILKLKNMWPNQATYPSSSFSFSLPESSLLIPAMFANDTLVGPHRHQRPSLTSSLSLLHQASLSLSKTHTFSLSFRRNSAKLNKPQHVTQPHSDGDEMAVYSSPATKMLTSAHDKVSAAVASAPAKGGNLRRVLATILDPKILSSFFLSKWYPLFSKKVSGSSAHFFVQNGKISPVYLSQTKLYFKVTLSNSYSYRKIFSNSI